TYACTRHSVPTAAWLRFSCWDGSCCLLFVVEGVAEKVETIAVAAGDGLGHGAERRVDRAGISEPVGQHLNVQLLSLVRSDEDGAWRRQAMIDRRQNTDRLRCRRRGFATRLVQTQVGVADQFGGASSGAFGQVAFGQRLETPGDAFDEPGAVAGGGGFAEE